MHKSIVIHLWGYSDTSYLCELRPQFRAGDITFLRQSPKFPIISSLPYISKWEHHCYFEDHQQYNAIGARSRNGILFPWNLWADPNSNNTARTGPKGSSSISSNWQSMWSRENELFSVQKGCICMVDCLGDWQWFYLDLHFNISINLLM